MMRVHLLLERVSKDEIPLFIISGGISRLMKRIEEDFGCFFKGNLTPLYIALGFVLIPLKSNVFIFIFNVHGTKAPILNALKPHNSNGRPP